MTARRALALCLLAGALGCTTYVRDDGSDLRIRGGREWGTAPSHVLSLRGHSYRVDPETAWRRLHQTLERFGLRPTGEVGQPQYHVSSTAYTSDPASVTRKLLKDVQGRFRQWRPTAARYKVEVGLMPVASKRTQVSIRVFPEVYRAEIKRWYPIIPNGEVLKVLYKDLDRRMPAYRDDRQLEWKDW